MTRHPEEFIHLWGEIFTANRIWQRFGLRFEAFLEDPTGYLDACVFDKPMPLFRGEEYYALLPEQLAVQRSLDTNTDFKICLWQALAEDALADLQRRLLKLRLA
jgi:hypothetical protein